MTLSPLMSHLLMWGLVSLVFVIGWAAGRSITCHHGVRRADVCYRCCQEKVLEEDSQWEDVA